MTSITDVAKACNVSKSTVSKALNGAPDIGEATRRRILETANQLGYRPNLAARALKTNRTNSLGVLYSDGGGTFGLTHEYFAAILEGFRKEAEQNGFEITFINSNNPRMSYYENCVYRSFDGVALICTDFLDPQVIELVKSGLPILSVDYVFNGCMAVMSDNLNGMSALMSYVYRMGHRRIAYIYGNNSEVAKTRLSSFYHAAKRLELVVPEEYVLSSHFHDPESCAERTAQLLDLKQPPTCILFPDDFSAIGGIRIIRKRGLSIPEDISVAGYDGSPLSAMLEPRLTTLHQRTDEIGKLAAANLIRQVLEPKATIADIITIPGILWEGNSVRKM